MPQDNLRIAIRAYLSSSSSTIKEFVNDILLSESTGVFFSEDEPDLTSGQKWDAYQPIKTEPIGRVLSRKQKKLSPEYTSAIKTFLISKNFIDKSFDVEEHGLSPSTRLQVELTDYANNHLDRRLFGETLIGRSREVLGTRAASIRFWNETHLLPLIRLSILFEGDAFSAPRWRSSIKLPNNDNVNRDSDQFIELLSIPIFKVSGEIICNFFQPARFGGAFFSAEVRPIFSENSPSTLIVSSFFRSIFCANFEFMLRYMSKKDINEITLRTTRALRAPNYRTIKAWEGVSLPS